MKLAYYPGCSLEGTAKAYNISTLEVCRHLGIELEEVPDWACCGSSPALKVNRLLSVSLAAFNLARIETMTVDEVVVPCPFCFRRLASAQEEIRENGALKEQVQETIEAELKTGLTVHNLLGFLRYQVGLEAIRDQVQKPLTGLKLAPYYGCYLVKPPGVTHFDSPEHPRSMDDLLAVLGAEVLDWDFRTECCGAGLSLSKTDKVVELTGRLVKEALWRGADALVVPCQLCHSNLDMRQVDLGKKEGKTFGLPIIYFTELLGLAFGLAPQQLGLNMHLIDPLPILKEKGLIQ